MPDIDSIALVECSSIALGYNAQDAMLKTSNVDLVLARTICSGKFLVVVAGSVSDTENAVHVGEAAAKESLIEARHITRLHPDIFPAISCAIEVTKEEAGAIGIVETFSAASIINCADAAAKAANVKLFRLHLAMAIGGKGFCLMTGDVASVEAGVEAAKEMAMEDGMLVATVIIPRPSMELFHEYI